LVCAGLLSHTICHSQPTHPVWPLAYPAVPSGSFGELRGGHFHSGIDLITNGNISWPVLAVNEGYISRIKISSGGYGKAIYIDHPDGTTTVYGHLTEFYGTLADTIEFRQYKAQNFELEFFPDSSAFPVKKGQLIGFSGNTGSSEGPHLHFEIRHTHSELPFDPSFKGITYADTIAPKKIERLVVYNAGTYGWLYGASRKQYAIDETGKAFIDTISVNENWFAGIAVTDFANGSDHPLGIASIIMLVDDSVVFKSVIDSFAFSESSMIKSVLDPIDRNIQLCLVLPGNKLPFYSHGNGMIHSTPGSTHNVRIKAFDRAGNQSQVQFTVRVSVNNSSEYKKIPKHDFADEVSLYEPIPVAIKVTGQGLNKVVTITPEETVFSKTAALNFERVKWFDVPSQKVVMGKLLPNGGFSKISSTITSRKITARINTGGIYGLRIDTVAPKPGDCNFSHYDFKGNRIYEIPYQEVLSGISTARCMVGENWVLSYFYYLLLSTRIHTIYRSLLLLY